MKHLFIIVLLICLLYSCNDNKSAKAEATIASVQNLQSANFRKLDTVLYFSGLWVNEEYVASIKKTRSPVNAELPDNSCILIPQRTLQSTAMIYGFHEGGEEWVVIKNGNSYEFRDKQLINNRGVIKIIPGNKLVFNGNTFLKVRDISREEIQYYILEEILLKGKYVSEDGSIVEFTADGDVKGISSILKYSVMLDFTEVGMQIDQIMLGRDLTHQDNYGFRFNGDTLSIYKLKCTEMDTSNNKCLVADFGERYLRLIKMK